MKKMKKMLSILLMLALTLSMVLGASAVTVDNQTAHTYNAYQIFTGDQAADDTSGTLANVEWGVGVNSAALLNALKTEVAQFAACNTAADVAKVLSDNNTNAALAETFALYAFNHKSATVSYSLTADQVSVDMASGYYLLVDTSAVNGENDTKNMPLVQVTGKGNLTIQDKAELPTVTKKIWEESLTDANSASGAASNEIIEFGFNANGDNLDDVQWNDVADYDIGDQVPFRLKADIPAGTAKGYATYSITFHDTMAAVFRNNADYQVYAEIGTTRTLLDASKYEVTAAADGFSLKVKDIKTISGYSDQTAMSIYVVYTAELLPTAQTAIGYENKVYLSYSNDHSDDQSEGETPKDVVVALTFDVPVHKYTANETSADVPLSDAEFKVYKIVDHTAFTGDLSTIRKDGVYCLNSELGLEVVLEKFVTDAEGNYVLHGLDTGDYLLVETKAPAGYNALSEAIKFTISVDAYDRDSYEEGQYAAKIEFKNTVNGQIQTDPTIRVENNKGGTLPETGGIGTTVFTVVGAALMIGAAVVLVAKKRTADKA